MQKNRKTERNCQDFFFQSNFSKTEIIVDVERVINHFWWKKKRYYFLHTVQLKSVQRCSRIVCDTPILLLLLFSKKWIFMQHRWCTMNFCICSIFYHFQIHTKKIYTLFWKTYFCPKLHNSILAKKHTLLLEIFEFLRQNWNRFFNFSSKKCQKSRS